jgi:hypothetical protein
VLRAVGPIDGHVSDDAAIFVMKAPPDRAARYGALNGFCWLRLACPWKRAANGVDAYTGILRRLGLPVLSTPSSRLERLEKRDPGQFREPGRELILERGIEYCGCWRLLLAVMPVGSTDVRR